jgi:hypothetical protein
MFSKERAMGDIPHNTEHEWYFWNYGSNNTLLKRVARRFEWAEDRSYGYYPAELRNNF